MKQDIHPEYKVIDVQLSDGTVIQTRSTMKTNRYVSEIDSTNHPFYTGKRQFVDTAGRVEKFMRRYGNRQQGKPAAEPAAEPEARPDAAR